MPYHDFTSEAECTSFDPFEYYKLYYYLIGTKTFGIELIYKDVEKVKKML